jgi:hypothetical protein
VSRKRHTISRQAKTPGFFGMTRLQIGSALAATALCASACALWWPHARDAGAMLAAQDDPPELADIGLNSALRNNRAVQMAAAQPAIAIAG